jgi:hypothetical protein
MLVDKYFPIKSLGIPLKFISLNQVLHIKLIAFLVCSSLSLRFLKNRYNLILLINNCKISYPLILSAKRESRN